MGGRLKGKVAIVTGAGRGLGRAHALALAQEGAKVVVNDLGGGPEGSGASASPAQEVVAEIKKMGGEAIANGASVSDPQAAEALVHQAIDTFGKLDILINNAGILRDRMVFNMSFEEWDAVLKVHLYGTFNTVRPASIYFRARAKEGSREGGRIINTSSAAGWGNMGQTNYSAAKEGIVGLTRTVAQDLGKYGVTCNVIRPAAATRLTITPELHEAWEKRKAEGGGGIIEGLPNLDALVPEMVSPMVVYLCTDAAANINGYAFHLGGGNIEVEALPHIHRGIYKEGIWTLDELDRLVQKTLMSEKPMML